MNSKRAILCAAGLGLALVGGVGCSRTVVEAPPAPQTEVITESPGPDYVWVGGYWGYGWGHYTWVGGHWDRPAHPHAHWMASRWEHRGNGYVLVKGYWQ